MRKYKDERRAKAMFMENKYTQKDIARILNVSQRTISVWAKKGKWREERAARSMSTESAISNGRAAVANMSDILIDLQEQRKELACIDKDKRDKEAIAAIDKSISSITDSMAKARNAVNKFEKENSIDLVAYLSVMDKIFKALQEEDPNLYMKTLNFQERHVMEIAKKLG